MNPKNTDSGRFSKIVSEAHDKANSENTAVRIRVMGELVTKVEGEDANISSDSGVIPVKVGDGSVHLMIHKIEPPSKDNQHGDLDPHLTSPTPPPPSSSVKPVGCFGGIVDKIFGRGSR